MQLIGVRESTALIPEFDDDEVDVGYALFVVTDLILVTFILTSFSLFLPHTQWC